MVIRNLSCALTLVAVLFVACISPVSPGDEWETATASSPASKEPRKTTLYLRNNGKKAEGRVLIRLRSGVVERRYVSKEGLRYSIDAGGVTIRYVDPISGFKRPLLHGERHIKGLEAIEENTVVELAPIGGRTVVIKAVGKDGKPLANTRLEVCEVWNDHEVAVLGIISDKAGAVKAFLADDGVYKVRMRWLISPVPSESKSFTPKETPEFTFTPIPPEQTGFTIRLVVVEGTTKRAAQSIRNLEITTRSRPIRNLMHGGRDGQIVLRLGDGEEEFPVGEKLRLNLPAGAAKKYKIVQPVVEVGKAGTFIEVKLVPIRKKP